MVIDLKDLEQLDNEFETLKQIHKDVYMFEVPLEKNSYIEQKTIQEIENAEGKIEKIEHTETVKDMNKYGHFIFKSLNRQEYDQFINMYQNHTISAIEYICKTCIVGGDTIKLIFDEKGVSRNDYVLRALELPILNYMIMVEQATLKKN